MIGYRSITHQGHAGARRGGPDETHNPYPPQSQAFYEYQNGCNAFRRGDVIDKSGNAVSPGTATLKHDSVHRQGTGW